MPGTSETVVQISVCFTPSKEDHIGGVGVVIVLALTEAGQSQASKPKSI